jgi:DNA replication protein DnaC
MTANIAGIGLVTDECLSDLRIAKSLKWEVVRKVTTSGGECVNCGDMGIFWFGFIPGQTGREHHRVTWYVDGQPQILESRVYPCPMCNKGEAVDRASALWNMSGLSADEFGFRLDWLKGKGKDNAIEAANSLLSQVPHPCGWATFYGDFGVGKSGILKSLTAAFIRAGIQAQYCRAGDILSDIRATFNGQGQEEQIMAQYRSYAFLAVDEVDRISNSDWAQATLMMILDDRYNRRHRSCTAIATNLQPEKLPASFGYLSDRMLDGMRIPVGGDKLRGAP